LEGGYKMRDISAEKLIKILEEHEKWHSTDGEEGERANLSDVDLSGANLSDVDLSGANLSRVNLSGANLSGAKFCEADLRGADLSDADLRGTDFFRADLSEANLSEADLRGAMLYSADLSSANLSGADLEGTEGLTKVRVERLKEREIKNFWYITSIHNLVSILKHGILCRSRINELGISASDISDSGVQKRRKEFHDFAPLFLADNTPMLYKVFNEYYENICLLEIDKEVKDVEGVQFSNGNVACKETEIYDSLERIKDDEWKVIYSREASYYNPKKRIRSAEVLVPSQVPREYITSISVDADEGLTNPYNQVLSSVKEAELDIPVNMNLTLGGVC